MTLPSPLQHHRRWRPNTSRALWRAALLLAGLQVAGPAAAQEPAPDGDDGATISAGNDPGGYVPADGPPAFAIGGYIDLGFADVDGDGTSFHPTDQRLPIDYAADPFATAINSRGDVASTDAAGRLTNGFLPRSAGIGGRPSFLINTFALDVRRGGPGDAVLVFARLHFVPRLGRNGSATQVILDQAFGRVQPLATHELLLFAGKFDSVFGIEYLENEANLRVGVTPSLLARYTTGSSIGLKLFQRAQLESIASAVSLNLAVTNSASFVESLQAPDVSLSGRPNLAARLGYELSLPGFQLKLGGSASRGPRNDQSDPDALARLYGADARLYLFGVSLAGEYLRLDEQRGPGADKLTGSGTQLFSSGFHVRGFWAQASYTLPLATPLFRRSVVYARGEQRRGWFDGFDHVLERRWTIGVRLDLGDSVALKAETLLNREYEGAPNVDNDVRCASLVWLF